MNERQRATSPALQCERDRLLSWLREMLDRADGVRVHIVVEDSGARSSVQITLHDVPGPLAGLDLAQSA